MAKKEFSEYLTYLRKAHKFTINYISQETGISRQYVYNLEHGDNFPSEVMLHKLSNFYHIPYEDFYELLKK